MPPAPPPKKQNIKTQQQPICDKRTWQGNNEKIKSGKRMNEQQKSRNLVSFSRNFNSTNPFNTIKEN